MIMAGDWIKIEHGLLHKPEVMQICDLLDIGPHEAVGHLVAFWVWVDQNLSPICPQVQGTKKGLDRVVGRDGFTTALETVGWLTFSEGIISVPNYDVHLSNSAKQRAKDSKKKAKQRSKSVPILSPPDGDILGTERGTREEKRREEKIVKNTTAKRPKVEVDRPDFVDELTWQDWKAARKGAKITVTVMRGIQEQADIAGIELAEAIKFAASKSWRSFEAEWYFKATGNKPPKWDHIPKD
jgi:hypothetical protein